MFLLGWSTCVAVDSYHNSYCLLVMNLMDSLPVFVPKSNPRVTKKRIYTS